MRLPVALVALVGLIAISTRADQMTQNVQQALKDQGFYYGEVTGDKDADTTAAIRRYQIRNGLQITGDLNEETLRSLNSGPNSVAGAARSNSKPAVSQPTNDRPDVNARVTQTSPPPSFSQPDGPLKANPSYSASFYQS